MPVLPPLDACGFVRVPADPPLWMTCDACGKSDHFWVDEAIHCRCGARYSHAVRPDGSTAALEELVFVDFDSGPKQLADLELDPRRVAAIAAVVLAMLGLAAWALLG